VDLLSTLSDAMFSCTAAPTRLSINHEERLMKHLWCPSRILRSCIHSLSQNRILRTIHGRYHLISQTHNMPVHHLVPIILAPHLALKKCQS